MKVVNSEDKITIYTCFFNNDINSFIKELVIKLKKKYKIKLYGFCQVNVYKNDKLTIIDIIREPDTYYFGDLMDLKINVFDDCNIYVSFDDYFWSDKKKFFMHDNKYYINIKDLSYKEFLLATEFCKYEYDESINNFI